MTKLRHFYLLVLFLVVAVTAKGGDVRYFYADKGNGPVWVALAEHPTITYSDNQLHVVSASGTKISWPVAEIRSAGFSENVPTDVVRAVTAARPEVTGSMVCFRQLKAGSLVTVYTADGKQVSQQAASDDGTAIVELHKLPKGICIIKSEQQTIKINNK